MLRRQIVTVVTLNIMPTTRSKSS